MLQQKKIVVIGGASGIGYAVAELAKSQGASVVIGSSNEANVRGAADKLQATGHVVDLRDEKSVQAFFEKVGPFDHLVSTAGDWGGGFGGQTASIDLAAAARMLDVRFWGVIGAVKHATKTIAKDGSIVLTGGMLTHRPMKGAPLATAIGAAMEGLARGFAIDLAPIRVNLVAPGLVLTGHVEKNIPEQARTAMTAGLPVPRPTTPAETALAYLYAMTNRYVTGQVLPVDGGSLLT